MLSTVAVAGCDHNRPDANQGGEDQRVLAPVTVSNDEFALAVHRLLRDGKASPERSALLAGTVRRQLAHASELFASGDDVRGTNAVIGALYLVRVGEGRPDMFDEASSKALAGAIKRFSARGDEGRAMALMLMQSKLLPEGSPKRRELAKHISALRRWIRETRTGGDMSKLAADERAAIGNSLLEPSDASLAAASRAIDKWIARAVEYNLLYQRTRELPPREEVAEAYKALQAGGETMAAVYLRHGFAKQALAAIETSAAGRVTSPSFFARLRATAVDDTAEDWRLLTRDFARLAFGSGDQKIDRALVLAALWGTSVEAYRRDPSSLAVGHLLADQLITLGIAEAAPLVLRDALGNQPSVVSLSAVMTTLAEALSEHNEPDDPTAARRIFAASNGVLQLADLPKYRRRLKPSAAQLRQLMASIELRAGQVDAARPLLVKALLAEPTVWGVTMLGTLELQVGNLNAALAHANRAVSLPAARGLPLDTAEARLLAYEVLRDQGANAGAEAALEKALEIALATRERGPAESKVRAERLLARVLDGYGERSSAARAIERAMSIAGGHRQMLGETMRAAVGRALVYRNVAAARAALQTGIKADVDTEKLVYGALWLMLLERELGESPDGKVDRVLLDAIHGGDWTATLARWAREMLSDAELRDAAKTYAQRIEAEFYISMRARAIGQAGADESLKQVAENPLIDLYEVQLAREILAPRMQAKLPKRFTLPR